MASSRKVAVQSNKPKAEKKGKLARVSDDDPCVIDLCPPVGATINIHVVSDDDVMVNLLDDAGDYCGDTTSCGCDDGCCGQCKGVTEDHVLICSAATGKCTALATPAQASVLQYDPVTKKVVWVAI